MILKFKDSIKELKSIQNLSLIAMFMAVWIILVLVVIRVSDFISISFEFIAVYFVGAMFGPFVGAIFGFFGDLMAYLVNPVGSFFVLYAVSVMVDGLIYGLILYKNKFGVLRVVLCQIIRDVVTNLILNTIFIHIQTGADLYRLFFVYRLPKNIIKIPINCVLIVLITKLIQKILKKHIQK